MLPKLGCLGNKKCYFKFINNHFTALNTLWCEHYLNFPSILMTGLAESWIAEELSDCHYRRDKQLASRSKSPADKKVSQNLVQKLPEQSGNRVDSVYVLPKVTFVNVNGTEIPVLDENVLKNCKSSLKREIFNQVKSESKIVTDV